jgi:hypothetical protein
MLENGMVLEMDRHLKDLESQKNVFCPMCGEECETIYTLDGDVLGCENCWDDDIIQTNSWDWLEKNERL